MPDSGLSGAIVTQGDVQDVVGLLDNLSRYNDRCRSSPGDGVQVLGQFLAHHLAQPFPGGVATDEGYARQFGLLAGKCQSWWRKVALQKRRGDCWNALQVAVQEGRRHTPGPERSPLAITSR